MRYVTTYNPQIALAGQVRRIKKYKNMKEKVLKRYGACRYRLELVIKDWRLA